jgi:hypothetical protein
MGRHHVPTARSCRAFLRVLWRSYHGRCTIGTSLGRRRVRNARCDDTQPCSTRSVSAAEWSRYSRHGAHAPAAMAISGGCVELLRRHSPDGQTRSMTARTLTRFSREQTHGRGGRVPQRSPLHVRQNGAGQWRAFPCTGNRQGLSIVQGHRRRQVHNRLSFRAESSLHKSFDLSRPLHLSGPTPAVSVGRK